MTPAQTALFRVYAALDHLVPKPADPDARERGGTLEDSLRSLGVLEGRIDRLRDEFERFADTVSSERGVASESVVQEEDRSSAKGGAPADVAEVVADAAAEVPEATVAERAAVGPLLPLVRVADVTLDVLAADAQLDSITIPDATVTRIAASLVTSRDEADAGGVVAALRSAVAPGLGDDADRWTMFSRALQGLDAGVVEPEVSAVRRLLCDDSTFNVDNEFPTRIETCFEVDLGDVTFESLARACMPENWPLCNTWFCSLELLPDRSAECGGTKGKPHCEDAYWRAVYEERVIQCPDGAFPGTYLVFTWDLVPPDQLVLRYELAPPRPGERPSLAIDEGYIQVDRVGDRYRVSTLKNLLFDDERLPSGGQTLAAYACNLGWLDYSITQFTDCGTRAPADARPGRQGDGRGKDAQGRLLDALDRCEGYVENRARESAFELDDWAAAVHDRTVGTDALFARASQRMLTHGVGDAVHWIEGQLDIGIASSDLAQELVTGWRRAHGGR